MNRPAQVNRTLGGFDWVPRFIHTLDQKLCSQCCLCVRICPARVFVRTVKGTVEPVNARNCLGCTSCERSCPCQAIKCLPSEQHPAPAQPQVP